MTVRMLSSVYMSCSAHGVHVTCMMCLLDSQFIMCDVHAGLLQLARLTVPVLCIYVLHMHSLRLVHLAVQLLKLTTF